MMQTRVTPWLSKHIYEHPMVVELMNTRIREFLLWHYFLGVTLFLFCATALVIFGHFFNLLLLPITVICLKNTRLWLLVHSQPLLGGLLLALITVAVLLIGYYLIYLLLPILLILWLCVIHEGVNVLKGQLDGFVIVTASLMFSYWLFNQSAKEPLQQKNQLQ